SGGAALVLAGEAGIGKTTLWQEALAEASDRGFLVLPAHPSAAESDLSLGAFADLFEEVRGEALERLPAPQRHALDVALLRTESGDAPVDQRTLSFAATNLLRELAAEGPVLVAIDDVQWLDPTTASIVVFAARRVQERPVGFLVSRRTTEAGPDPLVLDEALPGRTTRVDVGPLAMGELHQLLAAKLGKPLPRLFLIRIQEASGGNPFFAVEIARALLQSGAAVAPGEPLPVPATLEGLIGRRVAALPPRTRSVLVLAAAAIEP